MYKVSITPRATFTSRVFHGGEDLGGGCLMGASFVVVGSSPDVMGYDGDHLTRSMQGTAPIKQTSTRFSRVFFWVS